MLSKAELIIPSRRKAVSASSFRAMRFAVVLQDVPELFDCRLPLWSYHWRYHWPLRLYTEYSLTASDFVADNV